jgi:hypothetical protein
MYQSIYFQLFKYNGKKFDVRCWLVSFSINQQIFNKLCLEMYFICDFTYDL